MTDTDRMMAWLRETLGTAEQEARRAAEVCGCHPPAASWAFGDETTGRDYLDHLTALSRTR